METPGGMTSSIENNHSYKRWYDNDPVVSEAVDAWHKLPFSLQLIMGEQVNTLIESLRRQRRYATSGNISKLTPQKLMGLYKSSQRRRWYDQHATLRKAFNALALLEPTELNAIGTGILKIYEFLQHLQNEDTEVYEQDLANYITHVFFDIQTALSKMAFHDRQPEVSSLGTEAHHSVIDEETLSEPVP